MKKPIRKSPGRPTQIPGLIKTPVFLTQEQRDYLASHGETMAATIRQLIDKERQHMDDIFTQLISVLVIDLREINPELADEVERIAHTSIDEAYGRETTMRSLTSMSVEEIVASYDHQPTAVELVERMRSYAATIS